MDHSPSSAAILPFEFHGHKRLSSRDRVWITTDVHSYTSKMLDWSVPQQWFEAGALCLDTNHLALVRFSNDDVRAMMKAGMRPAPWPSHQRHGIELTRLYHGSQEKGRFREKVALIELDPELVKHGPMVRSHFEKEIGLRGNSTPGMWKEAVEWAKRENLIEAAALSFNDWFSAGMVKEIVGDINVSPTLARLVQEGLLVPNGKAKKGARYMKAPPVLIDRADWNG